LIHSDSTSVGVESMSVEIGQRRGDCSNVANAVLDALRALFASDHQTARRLLVTATELLDLGDTDDASRESSAPT
jgi:hypothetical protein